MYILEASYICKTINIIVWRSLKYRISFDFFSNFLHIKQKVVSTIIIIRMSLKLLHSTEMMQLNHMVNFTILYTSTQVYPMCSFLIDSRSIKWNAKIILFAVEVFFRSLFLFISLSGHSSVWENKIGMNLVWYY